MKLYITIVYTTISFLFVVGHLCPLLISAKDTTLVALGVFILPIAIYAEALFVMHTIKTIKAIKAIKAKLNQKENPRA